MLILLLLVVYLALGLPFVGWLGRRLAQASGDHDPAAEAVSG